MERGQEGLIRRAVPRAALAIACICISAWAHAGMETRATLQRTGMLLPRPEEARIAALGFDALLGDYYWLNAVQIVGGATESVSDRSDVVARLIELQTTLDPWVSHPYRFAALWLTNSIESVERANRLLARGVAYHPRDWRNRHYLGFNHFYYFGDDAKAAEILETAAGLPGAPRYLGGLVAKLREHTEGLETAAAFLVALETGTDDPYAKAEYQKARDEIETERMARVLDQARQVYRERNGRDIAQVGDLLTGPRPVLRALPPAHPIHPDFVWELDPRTGEIVSSYYRARYRPHIHARDRERRDRWRREREERERAT